MVYDKMFLLNKTNRMIIYPSKNTIKKKVKTCN